MEKNYYLGLDIGTDSVGYAASSETYDLMKFHGEPVWGVTTFEAAALAEERRMNRTARRRLDRRQQRVQLLSEIFAPSICAVDPNFFIRRKESALFAEDTQHGVKIFDGGISDIEYHRLYPTIHHLIDDLMHTEGPRDVRLVYLACAWLVANRGHFLSESGSVEKVTDFDVPYQELREYLSQDYECSLPWNDNVPGNIIQEIMQTDSGIKRKTELFVEKVFSGKRPSKKPEGDYPLRKDLFVTLLCGGKALPKDLFNNETYAEVESVSLDMDEMNFERILSDLGDDGMLLRKLRAMYDCALLNKTLRGNVSISKAKVAVFEQHAKDLAWLKYFIRKYKRDDYGKVFRREEAGNYVAYSYNVKNCTEPQKVKKAKKEEFSEFLKKIVKETTVEAKDQEKYNDMIERLTQCTFLPKQKNTDNRVIPQQLYFYELEEILRHAKAYLPMLAEADADGITNADKIRSIFRFKIPYYVGPLNKQSPQAWLERKAGKIFPWNFEQMVDLDKSEQAFINRMTNKCTYLPGEDVLPYCSLLYSRFMVLNELNNLRLNQKSIPVEVKQELFLNLFATDPGKITRKKIERYLKSHGYMDPTDEISGVDVNINAGLRSYHSFKRMLTAGILSEKQVEEIINHAAYSEDRSRMAKWLEQNYPAVSPEDRKYILRLNLKEFGRLSRKLLTEIMGCAVQGNGEAMSIMDALWQTNDNLMQLLSDRYTFREQIEAFAQEYYDIPENRKSLSERLSDMYISNAVKRPIIRALDITADVVKAMGCAPRKIFVEMARGGTPEQKGKRMVSRKQQILNLYKKVKDEDVPRLLKELEAMGEMADNRLQSDKLFLYYMQLGRCMYTMEPIVLSELATKTYDIDHIYPQSKVQDDSVLNNKVLVLSSANGAKGDRYPVDQHVQGKMMGFWTLLKVNGLITEEKFRRLTRNTGFSEEELHQFINRQLVETRQSTKVVAQLLKERYPDTEIVYVKAGMVSEFRQAFEMLKCRSVNDLHHAKDAYLNIVVGNVYHEKFTRRWFDTNQKYNISVKKVFDHPQAPYGKTVWRGGDDIAKIRKIMRKNAAHLTRYAFCRKGGLFDQMPVKKGMGLVRRKEGLPTEKYGGYNKPTAAFYMLASYLSGKKKDVMFVPVELRFAERVIADQNYALDYITGAISEIIGGKTVEDVRLLLNGRPIKINTVLSLDGMMVTIRGKLNGGAYVIVSPLVPLILGTQWELYLKNMKRFSDKKKENKSIALDETYDGINREKNNALYSLLQEKLRGSLFAKLPGASNVYQALNAGAEKFAALVTEEQVDCLLNIIDWFGKTSTCNLKCIGAAPKAGSKYVSSKLTAFVKEYHDVRIVDMSASGLFVSRTENLLNLL